MTLYRLDNFFLYPDHQSTEGNYWNCAELIIAKLRVVFVSAVRIVFFHFESNRIIELLFKISNRIE